MKIWNYITGELIRTLTQHSGGVKTVVSIANTDYFVSIISIRNISSGHIWNFRNGTLFRSLYYSNPISVTSIANSDYLAFGNMDNTITILNYKNWEWLHTLTMHTGAVKSVASIPNTDYIISGSDDKTIKIWNYTSGKLLANLSMHDGSVYSVAAIPYTNKIISGSLGQITIIWDLNITVNQTGKRNCSVGLFSYYTTILPNARKAALIIYVQIIRLENV